MEPVRTGEERKARAHWSFNWKKETVQNNECVQDFFFMNKKKQTAPAVESVENPPQKTSEIRCQNPNQTDMPCVGIEWIFWVQTISRVWNVLHQRQSLEIYSPPLPSWLKNDDWEKLWNYETVLTNENTAETAEVQVEAAARREQCECVQYEPPHEMSWSGKATTVHNHITRKTSMSRRATKSHGFILYRYNPSGPFGNTIYRCDSRLELRNVDLVGMSTKSWFLDPF